VVIDICREYKTKDTNFELRGTLEASCVNLPTALLSKPYDGYYDASGQVEYRCPLLQRAC
jgi:hypothetical protein